MNRDLSPDGQKLFDSIFSLDELVNRTLKIKDDDKVTVSPVRYTTKKTKAEKDFEQAQGETHDLKLELVKIIYNSKLVIEDCNEILTNLETVEDYIKSDAKVAKTLHTRLIERLTRVLEGLPAFEDEDHLNFKLKRLDPTEIYKHCK